MKHKPTPWQKVMHAAKKGRGLRLSAEEVWRLSCDSAIATAAEYGDWHDRGECDPHECGKCAENGVSLHPCAGRSPK